MRLFARMKDYEEDAFCYGGKGKYVAETKNVYRRRERATLKRTLAEEIAAEWMVFAKDSGDARVAVVEGSEVVMYDRYGAELARHRVSCDAERLLARLGWRMAG